MKDLKWVKAVGIAIVAAAAVCLGIFLYQQGQAQQKEQEYVKLRQDNDTKEKTEKKAQAKHDFSALSKQNEDVYAWILVPNTKVDYPVLQAAEDNFYLSHDFNRQSSKAGSIYSNACNEKEMEDAITIFYGHDMKAHTMFGSLHLFDDAAFFEENSTMYVETADAMRTYEIYGVFNYNDDYIPSVFDVKTAEGVEKFLTALDTCAKEKDAITHVRVGEKPTKEDKLLVLSTCISGQDNRRFLVVGKLVDTTYYE